MSLMKLYVTKSTHSQLWTVDYLNLCVVKAI